MFEELKDLVFDNEQMMNNIDNTVTFGFKGLKINAKVVDGNSLEVILSKDELVR